MNKIMFFNDYDNEDNAILVGFREDNVEKLYNCYGYYDSDNKEIDDTDNSCRTEAQIENGEILNNDGTPVNIEELTICIYEIRINGHTYTFDNDSLETDNFIQSKEDKNIWINENTGERYFDIVTDISNALAILKLVDKA